MYEVSIRTLVAAVTVPVPTVVADIPAASEKVAFAAVLPARGRRPRSARAGPTDGRWCRRGGCSSGHSCIEGRDRGDPATGTTVRPKPQPPARPPQENLNERRLRPGHLALSWRRPAPGPRPEPA